MRMLQFIVCFFAVASIAFGKTNADDAEVRDWLLSRQMDIYLTMFREKNLDPKDRLLLQESFHTFAFDYWLAARSGHEVGTPVWRYYIRRMLHQDAKNDDMYNDPLKLTSLLASGKLPVADLPSWHWFYTNTMNETSYKQLVSGFHNAFADLRAVFPTNSVPSDVLEESNALSAETMQLKRYLARQTWPRVGLDVLPSAFQSDPQAAFDKLTPEAKTYYLPAFMGMCERQPDKTKDLPNSLAEELADKKSASSAKLRALLTHDQKEALLGFFEEWYKDGPSGPISSGRLRKVLEIEPH